MIDTIVTWIASLTASPLGQLAIFYIVSGLLSLVLARRSQLDAWAEQHPRLAAVYKALRAVGIDPWMLVQALSLAVKGRLPAGARGATAPGDQATFTVAIDDQATPKLRAIEEHVDRLAAKVSKLPPGVLMLCLLLLSCSRSTLPALSSADAYQAARDFCAAYPDLPAELHTTANDVACAEMAKVCPDVTAPAPAMGNEIL